MRNHLKRLTSPKTWTINRKTKRRFIIKPASGPHTQNTSLPLGIIIRDFLKYTSTLRETKKLLNNKQILIDGKRRKNPRLPVGLFDVLSFSDLKETFRVLLDKKGRLILKKINSQENNLKPCKIIGKKTLSKKLQLNLHDGRNVLVDKKFKGNVGDTALISLPDQKILSSEGKKLSKKGLENLKDSQKGLEKLKTSQIKEIFELKKDAFVFLTKGKRAGDSGLLQEIKENLVTYQKDGKNIETLKKYIFVLGNKKPVIDIKIEK